MLQTSIAPQGLCLCWRISCKIKYTLYKLPMGPRQYLNYIALDHSTSVDRIDFTFSYSPSWSCLDDAWMFNNIRHPERSSYNLHPSEHGRYRQARLSLRQPGMGISIKRAAFDTLWIILFDFVQLNDIPKINPVEKSGVAICLEYRAIIVWNEYLHNLDCNLYVLHRRIYLQNDRDHCENLHFQALSMREVEESII